MLELPNSPFYLFLTYSEIISKKLSSPVKIEDIAAFLPEQIETIYDQLTFVLYHILKEDYIAAEKILKSKLLAYSDFYFFNLLYLKTLFKLKKYEDVVSYFSNNAEFLTSVDILFIYAASLYKIKLYDQCKVVLESILKIDRLDVKSKINIAKIYFIKKKNIKALMLLTELSRINKRYYDYYKNSILFYTAIGYQKVMLLNDFLRVAKKIDKDSKEFSKAMFNLALTYYDLGYFKEAKDCFSLLDKEVVPKDSYNLWSNNILKTDIKKDFFILKSIIKWLPFFILFISFVIMFIFIYIRKLLNR